MKIVVFGGNGNIGRPLSEGLARHGHEVTVVSRSTPTKWAAEGRLRWVRWNPCESIATWIGELEPADAVVNLARTPLPAAYQQDEIEGVVRQRLDLMKMVASAVRSMRVLPEVYVCASSHDIYGECDDEVRVVETSPTGKDAFARLYEEIEASVAALVGLGVRVVLARLGVLLGQGGNDPRLLPHVVANPSGSLSWIHVSDAVAMLEEVTRSRECSGPVNMTAPVASSALAIRDLVLPRSEERRRETRKLLNLQGERQSASSALSESSGSRGMVARSESRVFCSRSHWVFPEKMMLAGYRWRVQSVKDAVGPG